MDGDATGARPPTARMLGGVLDGRLRLSPVRPVSCHA